jgi:hypothetical protein
MIRNAVRAHFNFDVALDDDLITSYFDKLIQVPVLDEGLNEGRVDALALPSLSEPCADRRPELVAPLSGTRCAPTSTSTWRSMTTSSRATSIS